MRAARLDSLLTRLEKAKTCFSAQEGTGTLKLLSALGRVQFREAKPLIRFHDALLFLRAFAQEAETLRTAESLLATIPQRVAELRAAGGSLAAFDDESVSGIAGAEIARTFAYDDALWLAQAYSEEVSIDWEASESPAMANTLPRFFPLLDEDAFVEPDVSYRRWLAEAKGEANELAWLLRRFEELPQSPREKAELYESLQLSLRWNVGEQASRTLGRHPVKKIFYHTAPLIRRSEVSLAREFARPEPRLDVVSQREAGKILRLAREALLVRYRGLYGMTYGDARLVRRAEAGRGVEIFVWGVPPERRFPLRAYCSGFTLKNGVPINYVEAIALFDWAEIGFNTFYAYREGETAWIYAQMLRVLRQLLGVSCFSVYPYQIGLDNEEAIQSGAFWFYRKLGFRPGRPELLRLTEAEEKKIAARPGYRTPARTLRRLAEGHVFYELDESRRGDWDNFRMRNLGFAVQRYMARRYAGDARRMVRESSAALSRALGLSVETLNPCERQALESFALVLDVAAEMASYSSAEKDLLSKIIRSKAAVDEWGYLRLLRTHTRLREAIIRLGSNSDGVATSAHAVAR